MTLAQDALTKSNINKERFIYLQYDVSYYDTLRGSYLKKNDVADCYNIKPTDIMLKRWKEIKEYLSLCYKDWNFPEHYNTLDKKTILQPSNNPVIHEDIKFFMENLCWNKKVNIDYLHKSVLYKYMNLNDVLIPAVIFYWSGWSWKGTFIKLLAKLFGEKNTQQWLSQKDLESSFSSYVWQKLIVEFREINTWNKFSDKKNLDTIKGFVWESRISVNQKFQAQKEVDNIARFIMSSNHSTPIQLDSADSWNRRFTIIKTWWKIEPIKGKKINQTVQDESIVRDYLAWLVKEYGADVKQMVALPALQNEEKTNLEQNCESIWTLFFKWFEERYPDVFKISWFERTVLLESFRIDMSDDQNDPRYKVSNFDSWLSHNYEKKKVKIREKSITWYYIIKSAAEIKRIKDAWLSGCFKESDIEYPQVEKNNLLPK